MPSPDQLRARDIDCIAVVDDPKLIGTPDDDLLAHAAAVHRILVTANVADFAAIATDWRAAGREHAGLVFVTSRAFAQDRFYVGAIVSALAPLQNSDILPQSGTEAFLRRT